jgi:lipoprotein-releasing system ATP-binding protein
MNNILQLDNICKTYNQAGTDLVILNEASLELKAGEIVALIGPSGSGKSTLLQIAGLLDQPSSGEILVSNIPCSKLNDNERTLIRREHIGFIYQFHYLLQEFSVLENVMIPQAISGKTNAQAAKDLLQKLGLDHRLNFLPSEISGGEQQRVAIARALIRKPKLLLADEPTGNLDQHTAEQVTDILIAAVKEYNLSALIVTHNLELAARMDRVVRLEDGAVKG